MNNQIDIRPVLPAIRVPTLVLHRAEDRTINVQSGRYLGAHIPDARYVELPGADHLPFVGDQDAILDPIEEFLTGVRPSVQHDRVLATVLAMEVVNAPETVARVGTARWREIEAAHAALARAQVERHRGHPAATAGAGFLATFDGPARGIRCALAIIDESRPLGLELRAALHIGECDVVDGDLGGTAFRIATWAMRQADGSEVLVSSTVRDLVAGSGIDFAQLPERDAPDGLGAWRLFQVRSGYRVQEAVVPAAPTATAGLAALTTREREVALLVARGLTNRQIGDELVISAATAERHVVNIFNKLGFHSRSQVAAWVVEQRQSAPST